MRHLIIISFSIFITCCKKNSNISTPANSIIAPSTLKATPLSNTQINLSWLDNSQNEDGFKIERKSGLGNFKLITSVAKNVTSYADIALINNTSYTYRVSAYTYGGISSSLSNEVTATTFGMDRYYSPGGTYTDWYFPTNGSYTSLEWTFLPVADPPQSLANEGLLHYYAYNFALINATSSVGGGYAGFQTNGIFKGSYQGKVINFSIWGSNAGKTSGLLNTANLESGGVQIMFKYDWVTGHKYFFELKQGPSGVDSLGKWWGLWVTNLNTVTKTFIGEQRVTATINGKTASAWSSHTSMFGEDLHWWRSLTGIIKYTDCSSFQSSSMAAMDITANGSTIKPIQFTNMVNSGQKVTGSNGFISYNCDVSIYQEAATFRAQHNLGYWSSPSPNFIKN